MANAADLVETSEPLRMLFVDDDPNVLSGLRRMFYPERHLWAASFAAGGAEALAMLAEGHFDVIVSDMRMPGLDGAELLAKVRELDPGMVRIVLSGQTDRGAAVRAAGVAHQFLHKPTDAIALKSAVNRGRELTRRLAQPALRQALGRVDRLPSPSATLQALNEALADPMADMDAVVRVVEPDLGLGSKILQLVNSAFFALPREVASIKEAVSYLGLENVRAIAASAEAFGGWGRGQGAESAEHLALDLQMHSLAVAQVARAVQPPSCHPGDLFLGALLHDIGMLAAAVLVPDAGAQLWARSGPSPEAERQVLGATHADLGAYLLCLWGLPFRAVEAVARHHDPGPVIRGHLTEAHAVYVAEALVSELGQVPGHGAGAPHLDELGMTDQRQLDDWRRCRDQVLGG